MKQNMLDQLLEGVAFNAARERFEKAMSAAHDDFTTNPVSQEQLRDGLVKIKEQIAQLDPKLTFGFVGFAMVQDPANPDHIGLSSFTLGALGAVRALLPFAHLRHEQVLAAEAATADESSVYPECPGCGRRHPTAEQ